MMLWMGYPDTGQVTEILPPSMDFTEGIGRIRGGPKTERIFIKIYNIKCVKRKPTVVRCSLVA